MLLWPVGVLTGDDDDGFDGWPGMASTGDLGAVSADPEPTTGSEPPAPTEPPVGEQQVGGPEADDPSTRELR